MNSTSVEHRKHIPADLPRLLAELQELSSRTRPSSNAQRDRSKEVGPPCIVIRGK
jgi:hypothetical protein